MRLRPMRPALAWAFLILVLCLMPGAALPSWDWADLFNADKLVHATLFGVFVLLIHRGAVGQTGKSGYQRYALPIAVLAAVLYGGAMEWMQQLSALGRRGDWNDVIANTVGSLLGYGWLRWGPFKERRPTEAQDA